MTCGAQVTQTGARAAGEGAHGFSGVTASPPVLRSSWGASLPSWGGTLPGRRAGGCAAAGHSTGWAAAGRRGRELRGRGSGRQQAPSAVVCSRLSQELLSLRSRGAVGLAQVERATLRTECVWDVVHSSSDPEKGQNVPPPPVDNGAAETALVQMCPRAGSWVRKGCCAAAAGVAGRVQGHLREHMGAERQPPRPPPPRGPVEMPLLGAPDPKGACRPSLAGQAERGRAGGTVAESLPWARVESWPLGAGQASPGS